jgi:single-strand DNA-binding protein
VGNDPEIRLTQSGESVANLSIATSEKWNDKAGERREETEWHRVVFFGSLAKIVEQYLKKGSLVLVEGKIKTNSWKDKEGQDKKTTNIIAAKLKMLGNQQQKPEYQAQQPQSQYQAQQPSPPVQPPPAQYGGGYQQPPPQFSEDVPF